MTEQNDTHKAGASGVPSAGTHPLAHDDPAIRTGIQRVGDALLKLADSNPALASKLAGAFEAIVSEVGRSSRFAKSIGSALADPEPAIAAQESGRQKRPSRRAPGVVDPFVVIAEAGEDGLRLQLKQLDLEQLRDIVAEHGMDHDRLAMKWKDPQRVIDRIVERVAARTSKGSAFRQQSEPPRNWPGAESAGTALETADGGESDAV